MASVLYNDGVSVVCNPRGNKGELQVGRDRPYARNDEPVTYSENMTFVGNWCWNAVCKSNTKPLWVLVEDVEVAEPRLLTWMLSWMGTNHAKISDMNGDVCIQQKIDFGLPQQINVFHVDIHMPPTPHAWNVCELRLADIPCPVSVFEIEALVNRLSEFNGQLSNYDPSMPEFWQKNQSLMQRWKSANRRTTNNPITEEVLEFIYSQCVLGSFYYIPLEQFYERFNATKHRPWCMGINKAQFVRHKCVQEAFKIASIQPSENYQNKIWPRGSKKRVHTTFLMGADLMLLG